MARMFEVDHLPKAITEIIGESVRLEIEMIVTKNIEAARQKFHEESEELRKKLISKFFSFVRLKQLEADGLNRIELVIVEEKETKQ